MFKSCEKWMVGRFSNSQIYWGSTLRHNSEDSNQYEKMAFLKVSDDLLQILVAFLTIKLIRLQSTFKIFYLIEKWMLFNVTMENMNQLEWKVNDVSYDYFFKILNFKVNVQTNTIAEYPHRPNRSTITYQLQSTY